MWVIKSIGLGLLTVLAALFILVIVIIAALFVISRRYAGEASGVGWDPVSLVRQQPFVVYIFLALMGLLFASGFVLGWRRHHP